MIQSLRDKLKSEAIKRVMKAIISWVGLPLTGAWGITVKYLIRPMVIRLYEWSEKMVEVYGGREVDRLRGKEQAKDVVNANTSNGNIDSFDNLD